MFKENRIVLKPLNVIKQADTEIRNPESRARSYKLGFSREIPNTTKSLKQKKVSRGPLPPELAKKTEDPQSQLNHRVLKIKIKNEMESLIKSSRIGITKKEELADCLQEKIIRMGVHFIMVKELSWKRKFLFSITKQDNMGSTDEIWRTVEELFDSITSVTHMDLIVPRITWVRCHGIPCGAWNEENWKLIASEWGTLVEGPIGIGEESIFKGPNICIATRKVVEIDETFKIMIGDEGYWVRAKESRCIFAVDRNYKSLNNSNIRQQDNIVYRNLMRNRSWEVIKYRRIFKITYGIFDQIRLIMGRNFWATQTRRSLWWIRVEGLNKEWMNKVKEMEGCFGIPENVRTEKEWDPRNEDNSIMVSSESGNTVMSNEDLSKAIVVVSDCDNVIEEASEIHKDLNAQMIKLKIKKCPGRPRKIMKMNNFFEML